jgi:hypothetical protein
LTDQLDEMDVEHATAASGDSFHVEAVDACNSKQFERLVSLLTHAVIPLWRELE